MDLSFRLCFVSVYDLSLWRTPALLFVRFSSPPDFVCSAFFAWTCFPMYCIPYSHFYLCFYRLLLVVLPYPMQFLSCDMYCTITHHSTSDYTLNHHPPVHLPRLLGVSWFVSIFEEVSVLSKNRTWLRRKRRSRSHVTHQRVQRGITCFDYRL